jgi:pilus assembly protein FimV
MARQISFLSLLLSIYLVSTSAWGLALGDIELKSNLNQPFLAEISVEGANSADVTGLTVQLAARSAFERLGLDYPDYLDGFRLQTEIRTDGTSVVVVTSTASVTEPFVTILVEAVWARGRLLREYTVFLDPPTFVSTAPVPAPVQAPGTTTESRTTGTVIRQPTAPAAPAETPPSGQPFDAPGDSYRVQRNDTLYRIADRYRPDQSVSVNQMMMAIYEANPNAFMGRNINLLRAGSILRIPDRAAVAALTPAEANAEVSRQYAEWRSGAASVAPSEPVARLELRPPSADTTPGVGGQPVTGDAEVVQENEALRDELAEVRDELTDTQRLLELRDQEMAQLQQRLRELESASEDVGAPVAEIDESVEPAQPVEPEPAAQTVAPTPPPAMQRPAQQAGDESLFGKLVGLLTSPIFLILLGVAVIVAALLAVVRRRRAAAAEDVAEPWDSVSGSAFEDSSSTGQTIAELPMRGRSEESILVEEGPAPEDTGSLEMPKAELDKELTGSFEIPDLETTAATTGSFELPAFEPGEEPEMPRQAGSEAKAGASTIDELSDTMMERLGDDQGDPIGEADFHMAYGLYDQAADVVRSALKRAPDRRDLLAKLAEIYFVWGNKDQFVVSAKRLFDSREEGPDPDWDKILIMGKQIAPEEPIFSGGLQSTADKAVDLALEATAVAPPVDLSLAEEDQDGVDLDFGDALETGGDTRETPALSRTGADIDDAPGLTEDEGLDFDFSGDTQESPTLETPATESPTVETPTIESMSLDAQTMETPTLETPELAAGDDLRDTVEQIFDIGEDAEDERSSETAEIELDDLGLDVSLDDSFLGPLDATGESRALLVDEDLTAGDSGESTGIRKVDFDFSVADDEVQSELSDTDTLAATDLAEPDTIIGDEDATMLASALPESGASGSIDLDTAEPSKLGDTSSIDLDLGDLIDEAERADAGDTVEQPAVDREDSAEREATGIFEQPESTGIFEQPDSTGIFENTELTGTFETAEESPESTGIFENPESTGVLERPEDTAVLDLDVGDELRGVDDDPTATEVLPSEDYTMPEVEAVTMSEIGTKLDLARAYMDMGDPDGARSILEEVLDEGDAGQRADAERLMQSLP